MTDADISRSRIVSSLGSVPHDDFLVYLMGPYKSFNLEYALSEEGRASITVDALPTPLQRLFSGRDEIDEAQALLRRVQGHLRTTPGLNAFLATDVDIDTEDVDAATQSIAYARYSNVTAFVLPYLGHNFGVGEEAGSILETLADTHGDRMLFVHEDDVTSEMLRAANARGDLRVEAYETEAELVKRLRVFSADVMNREQFGNLDRPQ